MRLCTVRSALQQFIVDMNRFNTTNNLECFYSLKKNPFPFQAAVLLKTTIAARHSKRIASSQEHRSKTLERNARTLAQFAKSPFTRVVITSITNAWLLQKKCAIFCPTRISTKTRNVAPKPNVIWFVTQTLVVAFVWFKFYNLFFLPPKLLLPFSALPFCLVRANFSPFSSLLTLSLSLSLLPGHVRHAVAGQQGQQVSQSMVAIHHSDLFARWTHPPSHEPFVSSFASPLC
jgi:hypothetical protein